MTDADLHLIATFEMTCATAKNVHGMEGFKAYFLKGLSPAQRRLCKRYAHLKQRAIDEFCEQAKAAGWEGPKSDAPGKIGCAACDRGDFQLGHHHDCPKAKV